MDVSCAFCRVPTTKSDSEALKKIEGRADKGDPEAMNTLAGFYATGSLGLAKDNAKAMELAYKAAQLLHPKSIGNLARFWLHETGELSHIYDEEQGRKILEGAASLGDVDARYELAVIEAKRQHHDLAIRHFKLAATAGHEPSTKRLRKYYSLEKLTKAELEKVLRAYKEACDEMNSDERERLAASEKAKADNDDTLNVIYSCYYDGLLSAKELKEALNAQAANKALGGNDDLLHDIYNFYYNELIDAKEFKVALKLQRNGDVDRAVTMLYKCQKKGRST